MRSFSTPLSFLVLASQLTFPVAAFAQTNSGQQRSVEPSPSVAQNVPGPGQAPVPPDEDVVRITANLVQIDAAVTDKNGKVVGDLKPEDFEIFEDKKPQKITNFSFVPVASQPSSAGNSAPGRASVPPVFSDRLRPEQFHHTVAIVVDDLSLSFESTASVRAALRRFVNTQMQPNDLVAIIRTSAGVGALQQFTTDKRQLSAAIDRVRWYPAGQGKASAFAPMESTPLDALTRSGDSRLANMSNTVSDALEDASVQRDELRENIFSVGTLGALSFVVRGLRDLPGRKSVILMSDGFRLFTRFREHPTETIQDATGGVPEIDTYGSVQNNRVVEALHKLTDLANRSSVVIYAIDARGLATLGLTAADSVPDMSGQQILARLNNRRTDYIDTEDGLNYLAHETGGMFINNSNDLNRGIQKALDDQKGYYLIGYRPDDSTFNKKTGARTFHHIDVRVRRPGLVVRTRNGFYGISDSTTRTPASASGEEGLVAALTSPFSTGGVGLRLTAIFGNDRQVGSFVHSLLYIDGRTLSFKDMPDGWRQATLDVMAYTYGDTGDVVDKVYKTYNVRVRGEEYESVSHAGLLYSLDIPVKKPGAYQLRVALRDSVSNRVGSASQFIEIPDLKEDHLALSGILLSGGYQGAEAKNGGSPETTSPVKPVDRPVPAAADKPGGTSEQPYSLKLAGPAVRKLRPGMDVAYGLLIYNARGDEAHKARLTTQLHLFRNGTEIYSGKETPYNPGTQTDVKRLGATGHLKLSSKALTGDYALEVTVTDLLAPARYRTATQWADFEVVDSGSGG